MLATTVIELYMSLPTHIDHKPPIFGCVMPISSLAIKEVNNMNKNKLRSTIMTLVVATVLIGMTFGAMADSGNAPKSRLTISTADVSLTSMHDDWYYVTGMDLFEGRQLSRINLDMDRTYPERFERFSGYSGINHDVSDHLLDPRMNRTTLRAGTPDRSAHGRLADKNTAYQKVDGSDVPLIMSETTSSEYSEYLCTHGIPAGDLDGDGRDDVLVPSWTYLIQLDDSGYSTYTYTYGYVSAINGSDGTELWRQNTIYETDQIMCGDIPVYPAGDLDGDGKDDVIIRSKSYNSTTNEYITSVYFKRGYDGNLFWNQSITGPSAQMWAYSYDDIDGDDKDDVIVNSYSYNSDTTEQISCIYVKRGYDGYEFWNQSITGNGVSIWAESYCDLDGDGKNDVIVESGSYDSTGGERTAGVYAKRGYNGDEFWNQSIVGEDTYMWAYSCNDFDGDGLDDVIVESECYDSDTNEQTANVYVKRGYDGDLFWNQSVTRDGKYSAGIWASAYCDLDGDSKDDVIVCSDSYNSSTAEHTRSVYAKHGCNGTEFWNESAWWAESYGDLDGDGKDDVTIHSGSYDSDTNELTTSVHVKRGYDGAEFWNQSFTGKYAYMWAYAYCDFDGDDKNDVIVESESYDSGTNETTDTVYAKRGYDGDEFWNESITGEDVWMRTDYYNWQYYSNQDFDGDNLNDILIHTGISLSYTGIYAPTKVCAVKGNDGTSLWCKPSVPPVIGDLNGDGKLTPADAVIALNIAVSGDYNEYADVNDDGAVNSLDVLMILQGAASSVTI